MVYRNILMWLSLTGFAGMAVLGFVIWCSQHQVFPGRRILTSFRRLPWFAQFALVAFVVQLIVFGSTKTNQQCVVQQSEMTVASPLKTEDEFFSCGWNAASLLGVELAQNWWRRGCWEDWRIFKFAEGWVFPHGTNHLSGVVLFSQGEILTDIRDTNAVATIGAKVAHVPFDTCFTQERTPSNSYLFIWDRAYVDRDTNRLMCASIELFRNGDYLVTTNGCVVEHFIREPPFPHVGIGQDDDWVRANFTNATDILSVGYANWVDAQVGVNLENGLYKFTASFPSAPPEATELIVGDYSVCVTNAGDYVFVLEKGAEYDFGTEPYCDGSIVEYLMQDDLLSAPVFANWWWGDDNGVWTVDGDWEWVVAPSLWGLGYCVWFPKFRGSPDVAHLGVEDFPMTFEAVLSDCCRTNDVTYHWSTSTEGVRILSPNDRVTQMEVDALPSWDRFSLTVDAYLANETLTSTIVSTYGTNSTPQVSFDLQTPKVVFVNDDERTSRWYQVSLDFSCPVETNAVFSFEHNGNVGILFAESSDGTHRCSWTDITRRLSSLGQDGKLEFFFACTDIDHGEFTATCTLPSGDVLNRTGDYKVIEPLRRLVNVGATPEGGYYNPSRLVYGTNAWLRVGAIGDFDFRDVDWRVVSGPARIVSTNGWSVSVVPTENTGEVVVEAAFGSDSTIQPQFVLPIVQKRTIPVMAFVVSSNSVDAATISNKIDHANGVFSQVGVSFDLISVTNNVALPSDYVVAEYDEITNAAGQVRKVLSQQVQRILNTYTAGDCIELYFVNKIINGKAVAFRTSQGVVVSKLATDHVVAHELGHCFGLKDCYVHRSTSAGRVWIDQRNNPVDANFFSRPRDWGREIKRGFYKETDSRELILYDCLMYGVDGRGGVDIPSGDVLSLKKDAVISTQLQRSAIGADHLKQNDSEVFTR